ncbi:MAG TPA: ECF-type sigma factor [Bryobacteraceae bacterium]|nr:ECF-type sigma factor [Bryobacteraceae bacterium]
MTEFTDLLALARAGNKEAGNRLFRLAYPKLRRAASALLRKEYRRSSISPTVIIHNAYCKIDIRKLSMESRGHFYGFFARAMRQVLIDRGRAAAVRSRFDAATLVRALHPQDQQNLDPALRQAIQHTLANLRQLDPLAAETVWLRFVEEYTLEELAACQQRSVSVIRRDTEFALHWLAKRLNGS